MSGPVVQDHTIKNCSKYNATWKTMYRSLSQNYQPALPVRLQVHLQHRYRKTQQKTPRQVRRPRRSTRSPVLGDQLCDSEQSEGDSKDTEGNLLRDLPGWLEDVTENRVDEGALASRDTPASTSREPPH